MNGRVFLGSMFHSDNRQNISNKACVRREALWLSHHTGDSKFSASYTILKIKQFKNYVIRGKWF